ncbi:MAG: EAL domain-containing protein [Gammaproteobacteria bacterium]|nr:EAL domain-containing protein [Gammaproteobacteria bacterium]
MPDITELRQKQILIVEEDQAYAVDLKAMLTDGGFRHVDVAAGGQELLASLQQSNRGAARKIDLVLASDSLQDFDIYTFCQQNGLGGSSAEMMVMVLAAGEGWWNEETARKAYESGAVDIVFNPVRSIEIIPRVLLTLNLQSERVLCHQHEDELNTELAERKVMEARLQYLVAHDDMTGLFNRRRLEQSLDLSIIRTRNFKRTSALLYLDLDQFKLINDTQGHEAGDRMLGAVANLLRKSVKKSEIIARTGSDEFAILLENLTAEQALETANRIRKNLDQSGIEGDADGCHVSASIGVAMIEPNENVCSSEILARADQASFVAKKHGRNMVHKYSASDIEVHTLRTDVQWVPRIRAALANDDLFLVFQPVVSLKDNKVRRYECLLRMRGEDGETYMPDEFIPVAERMGLIHNIDLWVVENAIDILASLPPEQSDISFNVNLSGHAFQDSSLLPLVKQKLEMLWVNPARLIFEITETAAIANFVETREMVARLRALGCNFALDDFGAGFNSFNYIKNFPVDYLKIDGTFIINLVNDQTDQVLVKAMIDIARSLGKKTVAEYVENQEVLELLRGYGVDYVQGFHVGKPQASLAEVNVESIVSTLDNPVFNFLTEKN